MNNRTLPIAVAVVLLLASGTVTARGPWMAGPGNTVGWQLMTPEEQRTHRDRMRSLQTYDECNTYVAEHRALMAQRAKARGVALPQRHYRNSPCDRMKARGFIN
ncbi:hypothetical protein N8I74_00135 [Chitiniphilus purpureus]|uniref:DUF4148 domain-containing protein n=1 Tax=Chitiniphilus purpureus TaxID=2981137 RepID=A0ABY6DM58_9NEIS|nr:hypothetical protein [Chitiniphilus sp. CD1]UXY15459.1 hypothetical protein N8I74_00135 [Chitiniphilus sp. CD1]